MRIHAHCASGAPSSNWIPPGAALVVGDQGALERSRGYPRGDQGGTKASRGHLGVQGASSGRDLGSSMHATARQKPRVADSGRHRVYVYPMPHPQACAVPAGIPPSPPPESKLKTVVGYCSCCLSTAFCSSLSNKRLLHMTARMGALSRGVSSTADK